MPNTKSAKKRLKQDKVRYTRNKAKKKAYRSIKTRIKKGEDGLMPAFYKAVDKAAKSGAIHKNKASREKSRLIALVKRIEKKDAVKKIVKKSAAKKTVPNKTASKKKASK